MLEECKTANNHPTNQMSYIRIEQTADNIDIDNTYWQDNLDNISLQFISNGF